MAVKADWHEGSVVEDGPVSDPFALASSGAMTFAPLGLDCSLPDLRTRIKKLLDRERFLFDMGIVCPIKDRCDTSCLACPLNSANNPDSQRGRLCKIGVEQEQAETLHAVLIDPEHASVAAEAAPPPPPAPAAAPESAPSLKW
jgi:hypothetical protein